MSFRTPPWDRPHHQPTQAKAEATFFVFAATKPNLDLNAGSPMQHTAWCPYDAWPKEVTSETLPRDGNPAFFENFARIAHDVAPVDQLPPATLAAMDSAAWCTRVQGQIDDPPNLGYLQFCWATVRWLIELGGVLVLDYTGMRMSPPDRLRDEKWPVRPLVLDREVRIHEEGGTLQTTGLQKFARPDLVAQLTHAWVEEAFTHTAHELALGKIYRPGDTIAFGGSKLRVTEDPAGLRLVPETLA